MAESYLCTLKGLFDLDVGESGNTLNVSTIMIPLIQRDYAQGREQPDVSRIRKRFLNSLKEAVLRESICLDFVYGDIDDSGVLTLLDGQQRITTLFLLHWYAAKREKVSEQESSFLSRFTYETRPSSREFCKKLFSFSPDLWTNSLGKQIVDQSWFPLGWKDDPTIKSMLVMIDEINKEFSGVHDLWKALTTDKKIQFYFLPIKNMGLTDELYIKMNSRGKPLTAFEHFKAELEREIRMADEKVAEEFERKIDVEWTDFLWNYKKGDCLIDGLFLNYFRFICDIICYENGLSPQGRKCDEFSLIEAYFSHGLSNQLKNIEFMMKAIDCFCDLKIDVKKELFEKHLSTESLSKKARVSGNVDLLDHCFADYADPNTGRRSYSFPLGQVVLLYGFLQYALNYSSISEEQFNERIRIINNLVSNSQDEMIENRMPAILIQTKSIIVDGTITMGSDSLGSNFNVYQLEEEIAKQQWRVQNPDKVESLNLLENNNLLQGQISVIGLENYGVFDRFGEAFSCDRDLVSCALLTFGDYSRVEKEWRYTFGTKSNETPWRFLFRKNASAVGFERTKTALVSLLKSKDHIDNAYLRSLIEEYLKKCEKDREFDWRYYFIKYDVFRPDKYGKYWIERSNPYNITVMVTQSNISENSYQPFLKAIDPGHLDRDKYGRNLKYDDKLVFCETNRFVVKDNDGNEIEEIRINQNEAGIDTENRIEKYLSAKNLKI